MFLKIFPDGRMSSQDAAQFLGLSVKTLAMMRSSGTGPAFIKPGRVFYYQSDLEHWLNRKGRSFSTAQERLQVVSPVNYQAQ